MRTTSAILMLVLVCVLVGSASAAATVEVKVTRGVSVVSGATVTLEPPCTPNVATTAANGKATFTVSAAGTYNAVASITIMGMKYAAIKSVTVGATGTVSASLSLTEAIIISDYMPYAVGNVWTYMETTTEGSAVHNATRTEKMLGFKGMGPDKAMITEVKWIGSSDVLRQYNRMFSDLGWFLVGEDRPGGESRTYIPQLHIRALLPQGYRFLTASRYGMPARNYSISGSIVGFEGITVHAGTFTHCAHIQVKITDNGAVDTSDVWMAKGVGWVRTIDKGATRTSQRDLLMYTVH
jgi:hypothetical protein